MKTSSTQERQQGDVQNSLPASTETIEELHEPPASDEEGQSILSSEATDQQGFAAAPTALVPDTDGAMRVEPSPEVSINIQHDNPAPPHPAEQKKKSIQRSKTS